MMSTKIYGVRNKVNLIRNERLAQLLLEAEEKDILPSVGHTQTAANAHIRIYRSPKKLKLLFL